MKRCTPSLSIFTALLAVALAAPDLSARATICGTNGYDKNTEGYYYSTEGTYAGCAKACLQDSSNRKSFSFGNNECNLYIVAVAGNFAADYSSPYTFYDAACAVVSSSKSSTSTTTTKKAATTASTTTATTKTSTAKMSSNITPKTSSTTTTTTKTSTLTVKASTASTTSTTNIKTSTTTTYALSSATITSAVTTTKSSRSSSTLSTSSSTMIDPACPLPTWTITNFVWFNSSQNLDCIIGGADYDNPLCYTGRDPQPAGYGPPDYVSAIVSPDIGSCGQRNPGTTPRREPGNGVVRCGGSADQFNFYGNSNSANSTALVVVHGVVYCPGDGQTRGHSGSLNFQLNCSHDSGNNATCTPEGGALTVVGDPWTY